MSLAPARRPTASLAEGNAVLLSAVCPLLEFQIANGLIDLAGAGAGVINVGAKVGAIQPINLDEDPVPN